VCVIKPKSSFVNTTSSVDHHISGYNFLAVYSFRRVSKISLAHSTATIGDADIKLGNSVAAGTKMQVKFRDECGTTRVNKSNPNPNSTAIRRGTCRLWHAVHMPESVVYHTRCDQVAAAGVIPLQIVSYF